MANYNRQVSKKDRLARRDVLWEQPQVKWINVVESDGVTPATVKRHLVRPKDHRDIDMLKNDLSNKLNPNWGPVRNIFTPAGGTIVNSVEALEPNKAYAIGGAKFKPIKGYVPEGESQKKTSTSSNGSNDSFERRKPPTKYQRNRVSLMDRQDRIAREGKENRAARAAWRSDVSEDSKNNSSDERGRKKSRKPSPKTRFRSKSRNRRASSAPVTKKKS